MRENEDTIKLEVPRKRIRVIDSKKNKFRGIVKAAFLNWFN